MADDELQFAQFEAEGESKVRANLEAGRYGRPKDGLARQWLWEKEEARKRASNAEQMSVARSAKNAAWAAAIAAIIAAIAAVIALISRNPSP